MSGPTLPMQGAELARRLSVGLGPRPDGLRLSVTDPAVVELTGAVAAGLRVRVTATTTADERGQRWQVTIPVDPADLDPEVEPSALVLILRANLEEWWDRKDHEPQIAAWGQRIG